MTQYALRLQVIPRFGDPLREMYGHVFEIDDQIEHTAHPEILDNIITEHLRGSLNEIIEARRERRTLVEGARMPGAANDMLTRDDILEAQRGVFEATRGDTPPILVEPRRGGRMTRFMQELNNFMPGQRVAHVATDDAQAEDTFMNAARFWMGADGQPATIFANEASPRPRPATSHTLWPLTAPDA